MDTVNTQQTFAWAIKNPTTYVAINYTWTTQDNSTSYMWNDKNVATDSDGKSIFDPSPIGWRLPTRGAYNDFNTTTTTYVVSNVATYTPASASYYALGNRHPSSSILTTVGEVQNAITNLNSEIYAGRLRVTSSGIEFLYAGSRAQGYVARAIRE